MKIDILVKLASIHDATDYSDAKSVKEGSQAADALRTELIKYCDASRFDELLELLSHKSLGGWAAFVLAEFPSVSRAHRQLCVNKIKEMAESSSHDSVGAQFWLNDND